ncbi:MAG: hypothetical protein ACQKBV_09860 [Puniceicoccales bacterium]
MNQNDKPLNEADVLSYLALWLCIEERHEMFISHWQAERDGTHSDYPSRELIKHYQSLRGLINDWPVTSPFRDDSGSPQIPGKAALRLLYRRIKAGEPVKANKARIELLRSAQSYFMGTGQMPSVAVLYSMAEKRGAPSTYKQEAREIFYELEGQFPMFCPKT